MYQLSDTLVTTKSHINSDFLFAFLECPALTVESLDSVDVSGPQPVGTVATYNCFCGSYGDSTRTCQAGGTWTGTEPICRPTGYLLEIDILWKILRHIRLPNRGVKYDFPAFTNNRKVPLEMMKSEGEALVFQLFPREFANVNEIPNHV